MKKSESYRVPAPEDLDGSLAELVRKDAELGAEYSANSADRRDLEKKLAADTSPEVNPAVAELLGDAPDAKAGMRKRLGELNQRNSHISAAREVLRRRIGEARSKASIAVTEQARPEYAKRVRRVVDALRSVQEARDSYQELVDQFEALDVQWTRLGPLTLGFLGDRRDGHVQRFIKDAEVAGYA